MPFALLLYMTLVLLCCAYAALYGQRAGRWAALLIVTLMLTSMLAAHFQHSYRQTQYALFLIDVGGLIGFLALSLRSGRYWPIWMLSFQTLSVATHLTTIVAPTFVPKVYQALADFWAIPIVLVMLFGVMKDRRRA